MRTEEVAALPMNAPWSSSERDGVRVVLALADPQRLTGLSAAAPRLRPRRSSIEVGPANSRS
jgi:hypothetical protein